jgi:hypothetical protein
MSHIWLQLIVVASWKQLDTAIERSANDSGELLQVGLERGSNYEFTCSTCYR